MTLKERKGSRVCDGLQESVWGTGRGYGVKFYELQSLPVREEIAEFLEKVTFPPVSIWPFRWPTIHRVDRGLWKLGGKEIE